MLNSESDNVIETMVALGKLVEIVKATNDLRKFNKPHRRWAVRPTNQNKQHGLANQIQNMMRADPDEFFSYTRMTVEKFRHLLRIVGPHLSEAEPNTTITVEAKLLITLRYLAVGESIYSLHVAYRIGTSTIYKFVPEVCAAIWSALRHITITPIKNNNLECLANEFYTKWNLPNCVGALDGKHVRIKAPRNTGAKFFNYKGFYSIVLLALCDASYKFTYVDIGAYGSQHDSGIFCGSSLNQMIRSQKINLKQTRPLPNSDINFPYFIAGDEAFPLSSNLLHPYGGRFLSNDKHYFNQRLSRARGVIENTFAILSSRWRIYHKSIEFEVDSIDKIVQATVVLHNFLMDDDGDYGNIDEIETFHNAFASLSSGLEAAGRVNGEGEKNRDILKMYLNDNKL